VQARETAVDAEQALPGPPLTQKGKRKKNLLR